MPDTSVSDSEPDSLDAPLPFEEADFRALGPALAGDPEGNPHRLRTRRKLLTLGKRAARSISRSDSSRGSGVRLECRTSLHHPHRWNGMAVRRLWSYLLRPRPERKRLARTLGAELGTDLDAAFRNAYLCLAIEADALETSLRIHPDAWYDGQNLVKRIEREGPRSALELLNRLPGFRLRIADWKGEWKLGDLPIEAFEEFLSYWRPGEHLFALERRHPAPEGARARMLEADVPAELLAELQTLVPFYRYAAWSKESDFLFSG